MRTYALSLALACAACAPDRPATDLAGVSPERSTATAPAPRAEVELATPTPTTPVAAPTSSEPEVVAPPAKLSFEVAPYGTFEVVTWDEAARRADARIHADNAQAELRRIRQDVLGRRR